MAYDELAPDAMAGSSDPVDGGIASVSSPAVATRQGPDREKAAQLLRWADPRETLNIADELTEEQRNKIGQQVTRGYTTDDTSRSEWLAKSEDAIALAMQVAKAKTYPWPNASNIIYPLMTTAAIQFAARAYPAIVAGRKVVKGLVYGPDDGTPVPGPNGQPLMVPGPDGQPQPIFTVPPGEKRRRADRIAEHMSYQLMEEQPEWVEQTDQLLHILPIVGCVFRKSYFDPQWARNMSLVVMADKVVINYWAKSLELAPRVSECLKFYPNEIEENIRAEIFLKEKYPSTSGNADDDAAVDFIEQHCLYDLDEDGYKEPYIVTLHKETSRVARIVARFDPEGIHYSARTHEIVKIDPVGYYTKYDFIPNLEGGIYGMGFGQLLGPLNEGINTSLNMMIDASHKQVVGGGFLGRGLSLRGGPIRFKMGEYVPINATGAAIRDAIVDIQHPGANAVLFQLLGMLIEAGRETAAVKDILTGEMMSANTPAALGLAMIEQGLKVFTAIWQRVHRAEKAELDKLFRLNRLYLPDQANYQIGDQPKTIRREDYAKGSGVAPISDPNMVSDMQRLGRANFLKQYENDQLCNPLEIRRRIFDAASIEDADKIIAKQMPQPQPDPAIELAKIQLRIEGTKAHQNGIKTASEANAKRAEEVRNLSQAMLNMANVDKLVSEDQRSWVGQQWDILKGMHEAAQSADATGEAPQAPPMEGARQAPDGKWYLPDPDRPGKYLMVPDAAAA